MKIKLENGAKMPTRAHDTDAGMDIYSCETKTVPARGSATFDTGVHIELEPFYLREDTFPVKYATVGLLMSKSGLNVNHGITSEGVIDMGYTGSIVVKLYNNSDRDYTVCEGDKISQLLVMPVLTPRLELVDELQDTERGNKGFGSTGR